MVQAAEARERDDFVGALGLYLATIGGVLVQGEVGPVAMVVVEVLTNESPEMALAQHDDVVSELAAKRAEQAFASAVLPGRAWLRPDGRETEGLRGAVDLMAVEAVAIA